MNAPGKIFGSAFFASNIYKFDLDSDLSHMLEVELYKTEVAYLPDGDTKCDPNQEIGVKICLDDYLESRNRLSQTVPNDFAGAQCVHKTPLH